MLMIPTKRLFEMIQTEDEDEAPSQTNANSVTFESEFMTIVHSA